jgi:hypothetical protein
LFIGIKIIIIYDFSKEIVLTFANILLLYLDAVYNLLYLRGYNMEKRKNTRIIFEVDAAIKFKKKSIGCTVSNLSLNGALLKTKEKIPSDIKADTEVKVSVHMEGSTSELTINLNGIVVRTGDSEIAVQFESIDLDSFIHLKNIVAYNEGSEEKIMVEFYNNLKKVV